MSKVHVVRVPSLEEAAKYTEELKKNAFFTMMKIIEFTPEQLQMFKDFKHGWGQVGSGSGSGNNDCCILGSYNGCICGSGWVMVVMVVVI